MKTFSQHKTIQARPQKHKNTIMKPTTYLSIGFIKPENK